MSDQPPTRRTPAFIGGHWVLASLDNVSIDELRMHVSIAVSEDERLDSADLAVIVTGASGQLGLLEAPAHALPIVSTRGTTAFAQYTFALGGQAPPYTATVRLRDQTATFPLGEPTAT